jgi:excisionase family DNA binding protein
MSFSSVVGRKFVVEEAAAYLGISRSYLNKLRVHGGGPAFLKLGRRVVYDPRDLETWAASNRRQHTSQSAAASKPLSHSLPAASA